MISQFSSYFAAKVTSASVGYARTGSSRGSVVCSSVDSHGRFRRRHISQHWQSFDLACKELNDAGQPDVVHEVMIKRIIAAARRGERDVKLLQYAGLTEA